MTIKEKIKIHVEIEQQNREHEIKWKAKEIYHQFIKNGQFIEGHKVLELLRYGSVTLRLSDEHWNVQTALENHGFYIWFSRDGYKAVAYLQEGKAA